MIVGDAFDALPCGCFWGTLWHTTWTPTKTLATLLHDHRYSGVKIINDVPSTLPSLRDTNPVHLYIRSHLASLGCFQGFIRPRTDRERSDIMDYTSVFVSNSPSEPVSPVDYACMFVSAHNSRPHGWGPRFINNKHEKKNGKNCAQWSVKPLTMSNDPKVIIPYLSLALYIFERSFLEMKLMSRLLDNQSL